jgi:hypothetical protein
MYQTTAFKYQQLPQTILNKKAVSIAVKCSYRIANRDNAHWTPGFAATNKQEG